MMSTRKNPHANYSYRPEKTDTAVVFIHGIQGSPSQFDELIGALGGRYAVESLLLPGHGQDARAFIQSGMARWQSHVDERVGALRSEFQNIFLAGHSLGGLLAVSAAVARPAGIRGLFLLAVPLEFRLTPAFFVNNLRVVFGGGGKDPVVAAARAANSVKAGSVFAYPAFIPRYVELLRKIKATRALLPELRVPVVAIQSEKDEMVSGKSRRYFEGLPGARTMILENAGHYYYPKAAREAVSAALNAFIAENAE